MRQEMADVEDNAPCSEERSPHLVQKAEEYRFASNIPGDQTIPEKEYADYTLEYDEDDAVMNGKIPDVLLDVPVVKVDEINFELNDLRAKVNLFAKVLDLVELVGGRRLPRQGQAGDKGRRSPGPPEGQARQRHRHNRPGPYDHRPQPPDRREAGRERRLRRRRRWRRRGPPLEDVGEGAGELVGDGLNSAVEDIGSGAGDLVGEGANQAVADIGSGAGSAVEDVGEGAGSAVEACGVRAPVRPWMDSGEGCSRDRLGRWLGVEDVGFRAPRFGRGRRWLKARVPPSRTWVKVPVRPWRCRFRR